MQPDPPSPAPAQGAASIDSAVNSLGRKIDFKRLLDGYQARHGDFRVLEIPPQSYLMIDGSGDPNTTPAYVDALAALYPLAYALKFISKRELGRDYVVPPLEGLWWAEDMEAFTTRRDKAEWRWTSMLLVPPWLDEAAFVQARSTVKCRPNPPVAIERVRYERLDEATCVQTLHIGSFDDEGPLLGQMHHEFIPANGFVLSGIHHEIYLSDARRVEPSRLRTILRQPVAQSPSTKDST